MWLAHALTVSRAPFAIGFWLTYGAPGWSLAWLLAAAVSDALDGRVARQARRRAGLPDDAPSPGGWLDPVADKLFVAIALAAIVAHERTAWPLVACLAARELAMLPVLAGYAIARRRGRPAIELRAHAIGKLATVLQFIAVAAIVAPGGLALAARWPLAIAAGAVGVVAVLDHVTAAIDSWAQRVRPSRGGAAVSTVRGPLTHELAPHYPALRAIRTRRALEASPLWAEIGGEVARVLDGVERHDAPDLRPPAGRLRAVAWNIQRGTRFAELRAALTSDPELSRADVLLLSEVDIGMGRSGNRNVPRELAEALGASYAFAVSYLALEDDLLENPDAVDSTLALAGSAIISRAPILRAVSADVPALRDKFQSSEKRLGRKRAIVAELATASGPVVVAQAHLDSKGSPAQRAVQLAAVIDAAESLGATRLVLGGDLNTTTYNWASTAGLARDVLHKLFVTGFDGTVDNYMTPERQYERPVFDLLAARGLVVDGYNDRAEGTLRYDFTEDYAREKVRQAVGGLLMRWLVRRLRSRNGLVDAKLDWFAGRGVTPSGARVVRPRPRASDHDPIMVDIAV